MEAFSPFAKDAPLALAFDAGLLIVSAGEDGGAAGGSIEKGLIVPLGSGRENISLAGELKCGVLSTLELWISPLSWALRLLFFASVLRIGVDASLTPDAEPDV